MANRDRHTIAKVAWDNPEQKFKTEYEFVRDEAAIAKYGVKVLDLSIVFLSRLCGGECTGTNDQEYIKFLSRLCGGESN